MDHATPARIFAAVLHQAGLSVSDYRLCSAAGCRRLSEFEQAAQQSRLIG
jgi:hypothetical protein